MFFHASLYGLDDASFESRIVRGPAPIRQIFLQKNKFNQFKTARWEHCKSIMRTSNCIPKFTHSYGSTTDCTCNYRCVIARNYISIRNQQRLCWSGTERTSVRDPSGLELCDEWYTVKHRTTCMRLSRKLSKIANNKNLTLYFEIKFGAADSTKDDMVHLLRSKHYFHKQWPCVAK